MTTLQKINNTVYSLADQYIPKAKVRRFFNGVQAFAFNAFESLNAAGRLLHNNRSTGERRIERTVHDEGLTDYLQTLLLNEGFRQCTGLVYCSLDHSQFGPFCIAVLAISFRKGRSLPVWCQVNKSQGALIKPLLLALEQLFTAVAWLNPEVQPVLVMDRWFAGSTLLNLLNKHHVYFICRVKAGHTIRDLPWIDSEERVPIGDISELEVTGSYAGLSVRLIRSELKANMKEDQPWFLLTNLPKEITRQQVLNRYSERFEIEETFKDEKWLYRLEWQQIKTVQVIRSLLLFTFLGWWLMWCHVAKRGKQVITPRTKQTVHPKKQLSWFRQAWEYLQRLKQPTELQFVGSG